MQRSRLRHIVMTVSVIAAPTLLATVLLPGTATAGNPGPVATTGVCTALSGNGAVTSGPGVPTLSGCTPSPNADGTGTFTFPARFPFVITIPFSVTITWANGATTTFTFKSIKAPNAVKRNGKPNPKFLCPFYDSQLFLKGTIPKTGNGNLPRGDAGLKGTVKATFCVDGSDNVSLLAGTQFTL